MSQYSSLLLVLLILCVASSNSVSAKVVDVDVICRESSDHSYCSNLLNSKRGVDLVNLAQYTIDVLNNNWTHAYDLIRDMTEIAENDTVAGYYDRCATDFSDTNSIAISLRDAKSNLNIGMYPAMVKESVDIIHYLLDCIRDLRKHDTSPLLRKYVANFQQGAQVFQIITKYLNLGK
ncbi:hypothetical protein MTR_6g025560 [Medicago truncatula]|uniref:Pectinesterase inhibitor domain-containing protein n=1 Tax=Medicago truncatula TaxID=3880 RepID=G7KP46_MEDTR|nr:hypothetical protein MTR_6g025560 [Medicago truncatula]